MKHPAFRYAVFLLVLSGLASEVSADSWTCEQAGLTRKVVVYYPLAPALLPCEVFYAKPDENTMPRSLWKATNKEGYCEQKAEEFIEKLGSWGWHCTRSDDNTAIDITE
jgi:hypothetical protein